MDIIGRKEEKEILDDLLRSKTSELLAVYGRRRVGKTFLITTWYKDNIVFQLTGMSSGSLNDQLEQFSVALQNASGSPLPLKAPENWIEAFTALKNYLETKGTKKKLVVFLDEFPWLATRKSGFLAAFDHFWNTWASRRPNLLVIICGSAASWMLRNIINNKGGLHHRITQKLPIAPFTLAETEDFLKSLGSKLNRYHILQIYMAFGGIPHYLKSVGKDKSAMQAIEKTCFSKSGLLAGEFNNLYHSLFETADNHIKVVRALAANGKGLTRQQIIDKCRLSSGGRTTVLLNELEQSGFIGSAVPYDKAVKNVVYRLVDEFSLFYLKFMDNYNQSGSTWEQMSKEPSYTIWCGIAFEAVCLKHINQIKAGLKIKTGARYSAWRYALPKGSKEKGTQIDLIIDRKDNIINLCEMKFTSKVFSIDKSYANTLQHKINVFSEKVKPRKTIFLAMITTYGIKENNYSEYLVQQSITMDALFRADK